MENPPCSSYNLLFVAEQTLDVLANKPSCDIARRLTLDENGTSGILAIHPGGKSVREDMEARGGCNPTNVLRIMGHGYVPSSLASSWLGDQSGSGYIYPEGQEEPITSSANAGRNDFALSPSLILPISGSQASDEPHVCLATRRTRERWWCKIAEPKACSQNNTA